MMKKLSAIFMAALMIVLSVSIVGAATVDTEDVGSNGWKLATTSGIKAVNEGPVGKIISIVGIVLSSIMTVFWIIWIIAVVIAGVALSGTPSGRPWRYKYSYWFY